MKAPEELQAAEVQSARDFQEGYDFGRTGVETDYEPVYPLVYEVGREKGHKERKNRQRKYEDVAI